MRGAPPRCRRPQAHCLQTFGRSTLQATQLSYGLQWPKDLLTPRQFSPPMMR